MLALLAGIAFLAPLHSRASLVPLSPRVAPGKTTWVEVRIDLTPGWHTYWMNPGDSGLAPKIAWTLPKGWHAGAPQYATPTVLHTGGETSFGYEGRASLYVPVTAPRNAKGAATIAASIDRLVCRESCMPEKSTATATLSVAPAAISTAPRGLPLPLPGRARAVRQGNRIVLTLSSVSLAGATFIPTDGSVDPSAPQIARGRELTLTISPYAPRTLKTLRGLILTGSPRRAYEINVPI